MPTHPPEDLPLGGGGEGGNGKKAMLQDLFLHAAAREHEPMTVFLVNGVMLQGAVAGFDQFSLVLERGGQVQLVYKHAISTMQPGHPLNLAGEAQAEEEG
jgi:host factor-I protein